jgi:hypothetical protein
MSYIKGQWTCECPVCGFEYKSGEMRKRWDGQYVCKDDWEERHPLDYMHPRIRETGTVPFSLPPQEGLDGSPSYITIYVDDGYMETGSGFKTSYFEEL